MAQDYERHVAKDGKVTYRQRVYSHRDENGKNVRQWITADTVKDLKRKVREFGERKDGGVRVARTRVTFRAYMEQWYRRHSALWSPKVQDEYAGIIRRYIANADVTTIGSLPLAKLTKTHLEEFYGYLHTKHVTRRGEFGLHPTSIMHVHRLIRQALEGAVAGQLISVNPATGAVVPKRVQPGREEDEKAKAMTVADAAAFEQAARDDRLYPLWLMMLTCGVRPEEALGLHWRSVDLDERRIHITHVLIRRGVPKPTRVPWPKTSTSRRTLVITPRLVEVLKAWRRRQAAEQVEHPAYQDEGYVFTTKNGTPLDLDNIRQQNFAKVCRWARLGTFGVAPPKPKRGPNRAAPFKHAYTPYSLRHTFATEHLRRGTNMKVVSTLLGHADPAFTMRVYQHVMDDMQDTAVAAMDAWFPAEKSAASGNRMGTNSANASKIGQQRAIP